MTHAGLLHRRGERIMRKKNYLVAAASALALALTACGGGNTKDNTAVETTAEAGSTEAADSESTEAADGESTEAADGEDTEAADGESTEEDSESTEAADGKTAEISQEEVTEFAEEIEGAVMNKDLKALADLTSFPVYVASATDTEGKVENKEAFLALDKDKLFTEEFVDAITNVDVSALEKVEAGYVITDGKQNIIFNVGEDGTLGIVGINNK